jgi:hypothetical protein
MAAAEFSAPRMAATERVEGSALSAMCNDCGMDTTPRAEARRLRVGWEWYMVHDDVWAAAGMPKNDPENEPGDSGYLCIGCLERRLGRRLTPQDFTSDLVNNPSPYDTPRLLSRLHSR